ncbi:MAG TPA: hypothetical protein VGJ44_13475 [Kribbellaceae bacterium]|jgi:hypothetical protein
MPKFNSKKRVAVIAATALLAVGGGAAYAYWTTTGSGSGSAANATSNGTLVLHASFAPGVAPGETRTVSYTADNAGTSSLWVGTISHVVSTSVAGCLPADFTIDPVVSDTQVPAGASAFALGGTGTLTFHDTAQNQDACKGATVTLTLSSN